MQKTTLTAIELLRLMDKSDNYESIRRRGVAIYKSKSENPIMDISERCEIYCNPHRQMLYTMTYDEGFENCFDYEFVENYEVPIPEARLYKKCFVEAFEELFKKKKLIVCAN